LIKPRIDRRYPLSESAAALRDAHEGRNPDKIVVTVTGNDLTREVEGFLDGQLPADFSGER
jgi:hypothetical protein